MTVFVILCVALLATLGVTFIVAVAVLLWMFWTDFIPGIVDDAKEYLSKGKEK